MSDELAYLLRRGEITHDLMMAVTKSLDPELWDGSRPHDEMLVLARLRSMKRAKDAVNAVISFPGSVQKIKEVLNLDFMWKSYKP
jgi:hypothetical protein